MAKRAKIAGVRRGCSTVLIWALSLGCSLDRRVVQLADRDSGETNAGASNEPTPESEDGGSSGGSEGAGEPELPRVEDEAPSEPTPPAPPPACDAGGVCPVSAARALGEPCQVDAECAEGQCAASGQDGARVCVSCDSACDTACEICGTDGVCQSNGACDAFDCIAPTPPEVVTNIPADAVFLLSGATPPAARGGSVRDGRYAPIRVDIYGEEESTVFITTYEFRGRSVQIGYQPFLSLSPLVGVIPELQFAGTFDAAGTTLAFELERCDPQYELDVPAMQYTATANGLVTIAPQGANTVVITYALQ